MTAKNTENQRGPEDRVVDEPSEQERKEKMMDKTIVDSFLASDPPMSLPGPDEDTFVWLAPHDGT